MELNREVFAIPGSIHSPLSRGPHALIQEGAKLVESASDILNEFHALIPEGLNITLQDTMTAELFPNPKHRAPCSPVLEAIGYDPITEDTLLERTNMLPSILQCELLTLELNGDIERRPNGRIVRSRRRT